MIAWYASSTIELAIARRAIAHRGSRLEYFTIAGNTLEGLIASAAGVGARSISASVSGCIASSRLHLVPHCFGGRPLTPMLRAEAETKN
jgi:hypothetical protein